MTNLIKSFLKEEDGMGTVEIILIIAVLVGIALLFRAQIINFVNRMIGRVFPNADNLGDNTKASMPDIGTPTP
jgi:hypothetical protein